jgi:kinesin family member 3B
LQEVSQEVEEMYSEWQEEKEHYMDQMRILHQQTRLKELVIDLFVPVEEVHKVIRTAKWSDDRELWTIDATTEIKRNVKAAKRPVSASGLRRPTTDFTKTANAMGDLNPRFRSENILSLELDLPERTTFDYDRVSRSGDVQEALNLAFPEAGDVMFVGDKGMQGVYIDGAPGKLQAPAPERSARSASGRQRPSSARRKR